jgi:hypothetical protein
MEVRERSVSTSAGGLYSGIDTARVCYISLSKAGEACIKNVIAPFLASTGAKLGRIRLSRPEHHSVWTVQEKDILPVDRDRSSSGSVSSSSLSPEKAPPAPAAASRVISGRSSLVYQLPGDISARHVVIFYPVMLPSEELDLCECVAELVGRGVQPSNVTILSLVATRPPLWAVAVS